MFTDAFSADSQLVSIDPKQSVFLASSLIARGAISLSDIRRNIDRMMKQLKFVPWNQEGWKTGLCDVPPLGQSYSVLSMSNNTAFWRVLERLNSRFQKLYNRKVIVINQAHLHHYLEYMQQDEFTQARHHVGEIMNGYRALE